MSNVSKSVSDALEAIKNPPKSASSKTPTTYIEKFRAEFKLKGKDCWENTTLGKTVQFGGAVDITEAMITKLLHDGYSQNPQKPRQFAPKLAAVKSEKK